MSVTIHDRVQIIKNAQELDTTAGGGDTLIPPHGATHAKTASDPIPQELDGIPVDMSGITDGQRPSYDAGTNTFIPANPGVTATPEFTYVDLTDGLADPAHNEGRLFYDDTDKCLAYFNDKTNVKMALGRENWVRATNNTAAQIDNGMVVYLSGATLGGSPEIGLADASDYDKDKVLSVATQDIPVGQQGETTRFGLVNDIDTSLFNLGDVLYLSSTTPGTLTNTRPTFPARPIIIGYVTKKDAINGQILTVIETDQFDYEFDGCAIERQDTFVVESGGTVYAETELNGGGDLPVQLEGDVHLLNCTTGAGVGGRARVALTVGTDTTPQINFVFVKLVGGVPTLQSSVTAPTGAFAFISFVSIWTAAKTATDGPALHQRNTDAIEHDGRGRIAHICAKIRQLGASWSTGVTPTATITTQGAAVDDLQLTTTAGLVWQLHPQTFPALATATDGIYVANASGLGTLTNYQKITNLNQCLEYTDGTAVSNGDRFNLIVWGAINKTSGECKLFVNLSTKGYSTDNNGYFDVDGAAVTSVDRALFSVAFLICRIPVKYTLPSSGTLEFINPAGSPEIISLLGQAIGSSATGGSAGGGGVSTLNDLDDVAISTPADNDILQYNSTLTNWENVPGTDFIKADGSNPLTANWDAGSFKIMAEQFESDIPDGTAPLVVTSKTVVTNLNADKLDDQEGSYYLGRANHTGTQTASTISDFDTEVSNNTDVAANTTHRTSDGSDHTYIDQSVVSGSAPTLLGTNITAIPDGNLSESYVKANGTRPLTANWDAGDYQILSRTMEAGKYTTSNQVLRVTSGGAYPSYAYQTGFTIGQKVRIRCNMRSDGVVQPVIASPGIANYWVGVVSSGWQEVDIEVTIVGRTSIYWGFSSAGGAGRYVEIDNVHVEIVTSRGVNQIEDGDCEKIGTSDWTASDNGVGSTVPPVLSKQINDYSDIHYANNGMSVEGTNNTPLVLQPPGGGGVNICSPLNIKQSNAPRVNWTPSSNVSVTGTVTVDSFDPGKDGAVSYFVYVTDGSTKHRSGIIHTSWDYSANDAGSPVEVSSTDIGDTSNLTLTIDMSSGDVRLRATSASGTWKVHAVRQSLIAFQS